MSFIPQGPPGPQLRPVGPRMSFVVGKPPRAGTLVADVVDRMRVAGVLVDVRLPHQDPDALHLDPRPDLLVHRGLQRDAAVAVAALERRGVRCCNPAAPSSVVGDRTAVSTVLAAAGVPVPEGQTRSSWSQVRADLARGPRVVKAAADSTGRSARVVLLDGPVDEPPFAGPWQTQEHVGSDGVDRKLYVIGDQVHGLLKPGALADPGALRPGDGSSTGVEPFDPAGSLTDLARAVGAALGLHLFGVDVVLGEAGPVVVDVNVLPGYRGVAGAAEQVATHLLGHLTAG